MPDIQFRSATPVDADVGGELVYLTGGPMSDHLLGRGDPAQARRVVAQLFQRDRNRYSYEYADLALIDGEVAGLLLSYSGKTLKSPALPMFRSILAVNRPSETVRFLYRSAPLMTVTEVQADEYFVNNVAVVAGFRGHGVGKALMVLAEEKAAEAGLDKCALTVGTDNERAVGLYQHLGYEVVDTVKVRRLEERMDFPGLYRMVKILGQP